MKKIEKNARQKNQEEAYKIIKDIAESYKEKPEVLAELFQFGSRFYQYSPRNTQLIYGQNPGATYVASYAAWKKMEYPVKKGECGLKILVPTPITYLKIENEWRSMKSTSKEQIEEAKAGRIESKQVNAYKVGYVFDISQTCCPPEKYPEFYDVGYRSEQHAAVADGIAAFSKDVLHCPVASGDLKSISLRGFYSPGQNSIVINENLNDTQKLSTLTHELGHAMIHNEASDTSTVQKEFEADAVSIMLSEQFGLEVTDPRKRHLAKHYEKFAEDIGQQEGKDLDACLNEVFSNVYNVYRKHVDSITQYVEQSVQIKELAQGFKAGLHGPYNKRSIGMGLDN